MRKLRGSAWLALLISLMLLAAACGDGGDQADEGDGKAAAGDCDPATLTPLEAPAEEAAASGGSFAIAQAKPTLTIGTFGDRTGENSNIIVPSHDAMALAVEQANAAGNLPVTLAFKPLDNRNGAADTAPAIAQQFIGDPNVIAVLGGGFSGETAATGGLFSDADLLFFTASATRPDLSQSGFETFFRGVANDNDQGSAIVEVFEHLGCQRVAVVDDKTPYGQGLGDVARAGAEDAGMEVVLDESIEPTTDYTALVDSVIAADPQALFYSGYAAQFQLVAKQLREKGYEGIISSGDGSKEETIGEKIGTAEAENVILTCPCRDITLSPEPEAQEFVEAFEAKYQKRPEIYAAEGYDVANTTIDAIGECGAEGASGITRECVVDKVRESEYEGITKKFSFADSGEVTPPPVSVFLIRDGVVREVGPADTL
jgi:branched-chain amino acid transport system substrate-binding protein